MGPAGDHPDARSRSCSPSARMNQARYTTRPPSRPTRQPWSCAAPLPGGAAGPFQISGASRHSLGGSSRNITPDGKSPAGTVPASHTYSRRVAACCVPPALRQPSADCARRQSPRQRDRNCRCELELFVEAERMAARNGGPTSPREMASGYARWPSRLRHSRTVVDRSESDSLPPARSHTRRERRLAAPEIRASDAHRV